MEGGGSKDEHGHRLAVTRRCRDEDLGIPDDVDWRNCLDVPILQHFADLRGKEPEGDERLQNIIGGKNRDGTPREIRPVYTLHNGDSRAGTWYDPQRGVVWLLGVKPEAHDYDHLKAVHDRGLLFPTPDEIEQEQRDWDADDDRRVLMALQRDARVLVAQAAVNRGALIEATIGGVLDVRLSCEPGDDPILVVGVSRRLRGKPPIQNSGGAVWLAIVARFFFPESPFDSLGPPYAPRIDGVETRENELALQGFLVDAKPDPMTLLLRAVQPRP